MLLSISINNDLRAFLIVKVSMTARSGVLQFVNFGRGG